MSAYRWNVPAYGAEDIAFGCEKYQSHVGGRDTMPVQLAQMIADELLDLLGHRHVTIQRGRGRSYSSCCFTAERRIRLGADASGVVLCHELAHQVAHDRGTDRGAGGTWRQRTHPAGFCEAFLELLALRYGVDTAERYYQACHEVGLKVEATHRQHTEAATIPLRAARWERRRRPTPMYRAQGYVDARGARQLNLLDGIAS